ncbi:cytochrome P450 [Schizopora paradoxa]|uniref:Cytochrome P450 n=1 Tax=Schizopora paradoxa TaxID=27342 RepID=A0A0H2SL28_9AGAM|nr:cytochrome P450 [Schizopora paradoxa]
MFKFTPGVVFLARAVARLSSLLAGVFLSSLVLEQISRYENTISSRLFVSIGVVVLYFLGRRCLVALQHRRTRAAIGAIPVPVWKGKWPGNLDLMIYMKDQLDNNYLGASFLHFVDKLGPIFSMVVFGNAQFFTAEPAHIKQLLASEFDNFVKGEKTAEALNTVFGTGIFNADGNLWKFHRSMTRPFFTRDRISHFSTFESYAVEAISLLSKRADECRAVDVQDVFARFTMDIATESLFGSCVHSLRDALPYPCSQSVHLSEEAPNPSQAAEFSRAFAESLFIAAKRLHMGSLWPLFEVLRDKTVEPMAVCNAYLEPFVVDALRKKRKIQASTTTTCPKVDEINDTDTLLDHLVRVTDDRKVIKDEIFNIMIAGRDTTATTLTFAVYFLAMHPEVTRRLRAEVIEKVGSTRSPTYDDIREMRYLRAVINETLRLFPPVSFNVRTAIESTTLAPTIPNGCPYYVPEGTPVIYSVFLMHRRTDLWGPDALEFDPDRFLDERLHKYLTPKPFIFLPFNAGPRICLGQQFAYNEASFMLIKLLQSFDSFALDPLAQPADTRPPEWWKGVPGRQSIEQLFPKTHATIYSYGGLWVRMRKASKISEET